VTQADSVPAVDQRLHQIRRVAHWLDAGIRVPGTNIRIGFDPILGLVPGLGDAVGAMLGGTVFLEGIRRGASRATMIRIAANIALDFLVGAVPLLGDVFDFAWKANLRNVALLERLAADPHASRRRDRLFVIVLGVSLVMLCTAVLALGIIVPVWLVTR
jgi:hypothetical protein